ncbi:hypothetical protein PCL1606_02340 [Pseudomonas chlororaphis]|uniref:Uncharacterized protein n=1 Tax=Pseudomonas chlororaphis TaxID=587753 RepID=A0A0D5XSP1_9PSED|nr:hypothetical protein PCL1606_02340 [Pseudomonas chlororaphis]
MGRIRLHGRGFELRRRFDDLLDHGLSFFYGNFSESFGIHRVFLGGLFLLS